MFAVIVIGSLVIGFVILSKAARRKAQEESQQQLQMRLLHF
jgi:general stress protein CsbA